MIFSCLSAAVIPFKEDNIVLLNDGVDFKESSVTSVELQLNENKQTNAAELCKLFCMPMEVLNGKADEETVSQFVQNCLMPLINTIEAALDSDLLAESEKASMYFAFDTAELTRGDFAKRMNAYAVALKNNIYLHDEIRQKEDLPPLGFNYINLGLDSVLLDPKTGQIYTPNTGKLEKMNAEHLTDEQIRAIIKSRGNPNHDPKTGRFTSGGGATTTMLTKESTSDVLHLPDIEIGRSLSAKAKNYEVDDLRTGEKFYFAEGTHLQNVEVFAGKGTSTVYRNAYKYANRHGGEPEEWQHVKATGVIDYYGENRKAEVHWSQHDVYGKHDFFVKEWLE